MSAVGHETVLEMKAIEKAFSRVPALSGASFSARGGEVHALMGANGAGKSTMMNILGGVHQPDGGVIEIDGHAIAQASPRDARANGIGFVHQELNMLPSMTVAENVLIDEMPTRSGLVDRTRMRETTAALLARLGCAFSPDDTVETLGMGDRQMVEIARALAGDPRILIFDEPTSSLSAREKRRLFAVIGKLREEGTAVIYITHFLDEIFAVCDRVTVMRDGRTVGSRVVGEVTAGEVVTMMLGDIHQADRLRETPPARGEPLLDVRGLTRAGVLDRVDLGIAAGEIVGLWGLLGSGRTELLRSLVGLDPLDGGTIALRGAAVTPEALHREVGFVTEDRRGEGLLLQQSVTRNISFANLDKVRGPLGTIDKRRERAFAAGFVERLKIKLASLGQPVRTLSGGNQQKVVFARWLGTQPRLFFLDEPTRGLDVAAKTEILRLTVELAQAGAAVLIVSSELEELMRVCDRYLVIRRGRIVGERPASATREELLADIADTRTEAAA